MEVIDPVFEPSEKLFRRIKPDGVLAGRINPNTWDLPACSVDREKFLANGMLSVLPAGHGFAETTVGNLPPPMASEDQGIWAIIPVHAPENGNAAHSELRLHKDGLFSEKKKPGSLQRKQWKELLSLAFTVMIEPQPGPG
ncbi:MAG: hypothetical protein K2X03_02650 [Bryobacteraceae bacterium]|nr:hypothetical protein [Bryobacteraceae bacterium]